MNLNYYISKYIESYFLRVSMKSCSYFEIELTDYALPSFCSGGKPYYGTIEQIEGLIEALKNNPKTRDEAKDLLLALTEYKNGCLDCKHSVGYGQGNFLTPVNLEGKSEIVIDDCEWVHKNVWGFPYYMRAKSAIIDQIVVSVNKNVIRCMNAQFFGLEYKGDDSFPWSKLRNNFWGFPEIISCRKSDECTFSRLYMFEERYSDVEIAIRDLNEREKIKFNDFCDDIFGDG